MKNKDQILKLVEKVNIDRVCSLFNDFHEKFESKNSSQMFVTTKEQFDCVSVLMDCLDRAFFENDNLYYYFNKFWQNEKIRSVTYVEFQSYNKQEPIDVLLLQLLTESEEIKKQTNTVIIKLPTTKNLCLNLSNNFNKFFKSENLKNEIFLIFTNNSSLIELYETL